MVLNMYSPMEAYETYLNGNITEFKNWLTTEATPSQIVHITYLWLNDKQPMLKLKAYAGGE